MRRLGVIMHGITGRMELNQHLIRSFVAIRAEVEAQARAHGIECRTDDIDDAPWKFSVVAGAKGAQLAEPGLKPWKEHRRLDVEPLEI